MGTLLTQEEAERYIFDGYIVVKSNVFLFMKYVGKIDGIRISEDRIVVNLAWHARWDESLELVNEYDYPMESHDYVRQPGERVLLVANTTIVKETVEFVLPGDPAFAEFAHLLDDLLVTA